MSTTLQPTDPRTHFAAAVATARATIAGVRADQLDAPTPCAAFTVRDLLGHLVAVGRRVAAVGRGEDPFSVPHVAPVADGGHLDAFVAAAHEIQGVWSAEGILERPITLPWTTMPGAAALAIYTSELTVHTWDLATATGQSPAWDDDAVAVALEAGMRELPAEPRGDVLPFDPVVPVAADASALDRLVAWYGRRPASAR